MDASNADYDEIIEILSKMFGFTKERTEHAIQVKLSFYCFIHSINNITRKSNCFIDCRRI